MIESMIGGYIIRGLGDTWYICFGRKEKVTGKSVAKCVLKPFENWTLP